MTAYLASKMQTGVQPRALPSSGGVNVLSTVSLTTALVLNDTISLVQMEAMPDNPNGLGPTVIGMTLDVDQLDTNGAPTLTLDVGDQVTGSAATPQRFYAASNIAKTGGYAIPSIPAVLGYQPFASSFGTYPTTSLLTDLVFAKCHAAPATWQNGTLRYLLEFTLDP